jgi:nucleotidyltransferase substrate binding protein (TIGR01987 family)
MGRVLERIQAAEKALATLKEPAYLEAPTPVERDAAIQRFEYTFEAFWKALQTYLREVEGLEGGSPKGVFRLARGAGLLLDEEARLAMVDDRNLTVHTYNEALAQAIFRRLPHYTRLMESVLGRRKQLKNSPQIRALFLFRSRFIQKRKTSRRAAKEAKGGKMNPRMPKGAAPKLYLGVHARLVFLKKEDEQALLNPMRRFSSATRFAYRRLLEGKTREELKREDGPLCTLFGLNTRYADGAIEKAQATLDSARELGQDPRSSAGESSLSNSHGDTCQVKRF